MSNTLRSFIVRESGVREGAAYESQGNVSSSTSTSFSFLPATPSGQTFLTGTTDTFLTLPEHVEGEGEALLGEGEGMSQGPLLYLDPTTGLHVLVHHIPHPQTQNTPAQLVSEEGSQEQFVVVGALQSDDTLNPSSPPTACHVSVDNILGEELVAGGGEIFLPPSDNPPQPPQALPPAPVLTLVGGTEAAEGAGGGGGGGESSTVTLDTVPHVTLEEIIQKFASETSPSSTPSEPPNGTHPRPVLAMAPKVKVRLLQQQQQEQPQSKEEVLDVGRGRGGVEDRAEEGEDEGCLYDVVVTYRCRVCGEVFPDKTSLLEHHHAHHKQGNVIKIRVTSSGSPPVTAPPEPPQPPGAEKEHREISIHSCGFCYRNFLGLKECKNHITKEHPSKKRKGKGSRRHHQETKYPPQPGMLIGHRKARLPNQQPQDTPPAEEEEEAGEAKRKVKTPKSLQDQYLLQKQRPKPVCSVDLEKTHRCTALTCKYKFSSEANLQAHLNCHGGKDERGFTCPHCGLRCEKWAVCQLHLWKGHWQDIDLLTCGICHTYKTSMQCRLIQHQKTHSENKDHVCKFCGKAFKQLAQLINHKVLHISNPKYFPAWKQKAYCDQCQRWFEKKLLRIHIITVHWKHKPLTCTHCTYRCTRKYDMKVHIRQHTGERPYRCPVCGFQSRDHNTMRRHKLVHLDLKPFRCPLTPCQFEARCLAYFKRHMSRKHPDAQAMFRCQFCPLKTECLKEYIAHAGMHEKSMVAEAVHLRTKVKDEPNEAPGRSLDTISDVPQTTTPATTTTTTTTTVPKDTPQQMANHSAQVITIQVEEASGSKAAQNRRSRSSEAGAEGEAAVGSEKEGRKVVSVPQVVMSENGSQYIIGITPTFTTTTITTNHADTTHHNARHQHSAL